MLFQFGFRGFVSIQLHTHRLRSMNSMPLPPFQAGRDLPRVRLVNASVRLDFWATADRPSARRYRSTSSRCRNAASTCLRWAEELRGRLSGDLGMVNSFLRKSDTPPASTFRRTFNIGMACSPPNKSRAWVITLPKRSLRPKRLKGADLISQDRFLAGPRAPSSSGVGSRLPSPFRMLWAIAASR